ncbi:MAG: NAD(+)/NADH kinase [Dehalococcoidia bacterium]|nr:NAD(+)/NADH kinase [Dehalococcoidia bacterium]
MITVGVIANPAAGKDIRRLVAAGRVVSNQEKANTLRRVFAGLVSTGVERVLVMPDLSRLAAPAMEDVESQIDASYLEMQRIDHQDGSTRAARMMADEGAGAIVTLGGDGTNRVVAKGAGDVPIVPISTGTNNVFPQMVEGTLAGIAAGSVAMGVDGVDEAVTRCKRLNVLVNDELADMALIDAAVSTEMFVGARAVWNMETVEEVFLTRAEPASIGISAVGSRLRPVAIDEPFGLRIKLGEGNGPTARSVMAPIAPGMVPEVAVSEWGVLQPGERRLIQRRPGTIALDGEREVTLLPGQKVEIVLALDGPKVVDVTHALRLLAPRDDGGDDE